MGERSFSAATAFVSCEALKKIDGTTDFRLASFTKQFTAMAVMLLVHDGKLRYDQPLTEIFPDLPQCARAITVRHLLTHTSGLPDYEDVMDAHQWTPQRQIQDEEVLALLKRQTNPKFAAGTSWAYSNSAYVLLGLIVAKVSGEALRAVSGRSNLQAAAHEQHTGLPERHEHGARTAHTGIRQRAGEFVETRPEFHLCDSGRWRRLFKPGRSGQMGCSATRSQLLGEPEMRVALTPVKLANGGQTNWPSTPGDDNLNPGKPVAYGFGWFLDPYRGHARMWHTGSTRGFRTVIERFPAEEARR